MNDRELTQDRMVHEGLRELAGHEVERDYVAAVQARLAGTGVDAVAADTPQEQARRRWGAEQSESASSPGIPEAARYGWLWQAAIVLLGVGVVFAAVMTQSDEGSASARDFEAMHELPRYTVRTASQVASLPPHAQRVSVLLAGDEIGRVLDALVAFDRDRANPGLADVFVKWTTDEWDASMNDARLAQLARLEHVQKLDFELAPTTTAAGLGELAKLSNLRALWLRGCILESVELEALAALPKLRELFVEWTYAEPVVPRPARSLEFLASLPKLERLHLDNGWHLVEGDFEVLAGLRDLRALALRKCGGKRDPDAGPQSVDGDQVGATDATLRMLARLPRLEELDLTSLHAITPEGLAALEGLSSLRSLVPPAGLSEAAMAALPRQIEELDAEWLTVPPSSLARLTNLRRIRLTRGGYSSDTWNALPAGQLESLRVSGLHEVVMPPEFLQRCRSLRELSLAGRALTAEHLDAIPGMVELRSLELWSAELTAEQIGRFAACEHLQSLTLGSFQVRSEEQLMDSLTRLSELPLRKLVLPSHVARTSTLDALLQRLWPGVVVEWD